MARKRKFAADTTPTAIRKERSLPDGVAVQIEPSANFDRVRPQVSSPAAARMDTAFEQIRHYAKSDIAVSLRLLRAFDDMVLAGASRKETQSLIGRARRVVAGCELNLDKDDVLPLRRRLARLEGRLQTQLRAE